MRTVTIVHHSAGHKTQTIASIERFHKPKYGRVYYAEIIGPDRTYKMHNELNPRTKNVQSYDICYLGDFTQVRPTEYQLKDLVHRFGSEGFVGHTEATKLYRASASACPGKLEQYYEEYVAQGAPKEKLKALALQVVSLYQKGKITKELTIKLLTSLITKLQHA
jgi:hypothetical protein